MNPHPFVDLLTEALNLTHPRFALAFGEEYGPHETDAAARRERERPFLCEFVHQFRHLWERGLPGRLGRRRRRCTRLHRLRVHHRFRIDPDGFVRAVALESVE